MEEAGFQLGAKLNGEKVRQIFLNLSKSYTQYNSYVKNTTGTTPKDAPEFYDQSNAILGDKHKSHPTYITGSMKQVTGVEELNQTSLSTIEQIELEAANITCINLDNVDKNNEENETDNTNTNDELKKPNRYEHIKNTVKPNNEKNNLLQEIKNICLEGNEIARGQSNSIEKLLREQNNILKENSQKQIRQREKMLVIMEKLISSKKRKHESDSD